MLAWAMPAQADTPADMAAYCVDQFGSGTISGFDRRNNAPLCSERTSNGLGLLHHVVDPAAVCTAQHQTSQFRKEGPKVICLTTSTGQSSGSEKIDLTTYCSNTYGQSAVVSRRLTDNQPLCTVKGSGGLSQTHYLIDVAELCGEGSGSGSLNGDTLECDGLPVANSPSQKAANNGSAQPPKSGQAQTQSTGGSQNDSAGGAASPAENVRLYSRAELAELDLSDCGYIQASKNMAENLANAQKAAKNENGRGGFGWEHGGVDTPCRALGQGLTVDLDAFCRFMNPTYETPRALGFTTSGRPMCLGPQDDRDEAWWSGHGMQLTSACSYAYPGGDAPFREGELWPIIKYVEGSLQCFYYKQRPDTEAPEIFTEVET
ncbi:MAG: hypothetical protein ABJN26_25770 [Stappiaceae bacterium]